MNTTIMSSKGQIIIPKSLIVKNQQGEDITEELITIKKGKTHLNKTLMPAMIT